MPDKEWSIAGHRLDRPCFACRLPILSGDGYEESDLDGTASYQHIQCVSAIVPDTLDYLRDGDDVLPEGILVDGYLDEEDIDPDWRSWYMNRLAQEGL